MTVIADPDVKLTERFVSYDARNKLGAATRGF